ncbi:MAG: hypothetical protein KJO80_16510 [Gammaproteobacteria bacterium]|nr:hypothetical protein [Gammaproteobacteria bacterium]
MIAQVRGAILTSTVLFCIPAKAATSMALQSVNNTDSSGDSRLRGDDVYTREITYLRAGLT